jgi:hypothetical protein
MAWIELSGRIHWEEASKPAANPDSTGKRGGTE